MTDEQVVTIKSRWLCRLYMDCPFCGEPIELSGDESIDELVFQPFQVFPEKFMGEEVQCFECKERFVMEEDQEMVVYWKCVLGCECPSCGEHIELSEARDPSELDNLTSSGEYELFFETETTCSECKSVFIIEEPEEELPVL
jgi:glycyl-tRNA synthetase (class II)